jgi:hypothetical protein
VCDLFLLLLPFLWPSAECDFGPILLLLVGVLNWARFSLSLAGLFPFCFSVSTLLLCFFGFGFCSPSCCCTYVNLCCLSLYVRFCLCLRYRVFLYSDLCVYGLNMGLCGFGPHHCPTHRQQKKIVRRWGTCASGCDVVWRGPRWARRLLVVTGARCPIKSPAVGAAVELQTTTEPHCSRGAGVQPGGICAYVVPHEPASEGPGACWRPGNRRFPCQLPAPALLFFI